MSWYVIAITASRHRKILEKLDTIDGIELFYPQRTVWRKQRTGPRIAKNFPLIPSYVFVGCDLNYTSARSILSIDGVHHFLGIDGVPSLVDIDQLARIRACEAHGDYDQTAAYIEQALVGATLTINSTAFEGFSGVVTSVIDGKAELDISIFGKTTPIKIDVDSLSKPI